MNRTALLPAAYLIDQLAGDPEWFPHPVRLIGAAITKGEAQLRRSGQSAMFELLSGTGLTMAVVGSSYWLTASAIRSANRHSRYLGNAVELLLAWTCLAAHNLEQEATAVTGALQNGNLMLARNRLARIVGRDTQELDHEGISRAVIETVAESAADGIITPLLYMALGGVPLAMAYKAVNTLDSMIGHADSTYFYFGKAAARLDDLANYAPSRLSALAIVAASNLQTHADAQSAWATWRRDGSKHKSPNAGQPESAMSGALRVALGGENTYSGERIPSERIGGEFKPPTYTQAAQAIRVVSVASVVGLGFSVALTLLLRTRNRD